MPAHSPQRRVLASRAAGLTRRRAPDDPVVLDALREVRAAAAEDYIRRLVDTAPPLTPEQRDRLAVLLRPDPSSTGSAA